jgi:hypothetical protein
MRKREKNDIRDGELCKHREEVEGLEQNIFGDILEFIDDLETARRSSRDEAMFRPELN